MFEGMPKWAPWALGIVVVLVILIVLYFTVWKDSFFGMGNIAGVIQSTGGSIQGTASPITVPPGSQAYCDQMFRNGQMDAQSHASCVANARYQGMQHQIAYENEHGLSDAARNFGSSVSHAFSF